tara:strand:- start:340 stop:546 length:207 start_codon:yes stop_codon:yes gene_type:complete
MTLDEFKKRLDAIAPPSEWYKKMSTEEQDAFHESVELARATLPERLKNRSELVQNMFIIHGVELKNES